MRYSQAFEGREAEEGSGFYEADPVTAQVPEEKGNALVHQQMTARTPSHPCISCSLGHQRGAL